MNIFINPENYRNCCLEIKDRNIYIKDFENGVSEISDDKDFHFHITNDTYESICFLKIDKCVLDDGESKKCDFAISDIENIFFIEVKELNNFEKHNKRTKKRKEAKDQLINTINYFKKLHIEMNLEKVFAIIALQPNIEEEYLKIISAKEQNVIDDFFEKCGCINIYEGNSIVI